VLCRPEYGCTSGVPFSESRSSHSGCPRRCGVASLSLGFPVLPLGCPCRCVFPDVATGLPCRVTMSAMNVMVPPRCCWIHRCQDLTHVTVGLSLST
jgi:hypothetical protein